MEKTVILLIAVLVGAFGPFSWRSPLFIKGSVAAASAENPNPITAQTLSSMQEAIDIGLANNPELKAEFHSVAASREDIGIAGSYRLPKVALEERVMHTNNPTYGFMAKLNQERFTAHDFDINALNNPEPITDFQTTVSVEMPLFAPRLGLGHDMSRVEALTRTEELARKREEIALQAGKAYLMTITAKKLVTAASQAKAAAVEHRRLAQLRYDNDLGLYSDILQAATAETKAEQQLLTAENNAEIARRSLGLVLGMVGPVDVLAEPRPIEVRDINYYLENAKKRADIRAMEQRLRNADINLKLVKSDFLPSFGFGASYQFNDHDSPLGTEGDSWQISASLKWELFDGMKRRHETNKAALQVAETEAYLDGLRKAVAYRVNEAFLKAGEAAHNNLLAKTALQTAEEGARLVTVRYENSLAPMVSLFDAQTTLDRARVNVVAQENAHLLAILTLACESGTILQHFSLNQSGTMEEDI